MKRIITTIALLMTLGSTLYAQLPTFEWRIENEQLTAANTYQFDVNLYNTGTTTFELRAGTIALFYNTSWVNGGTLTITAPSSGLAANNQIGTITNSTTAPAYFRKIIGGTQPGTFISGGSKVKCFTIQIANTANFSTTATPNLSWKFTSPSAGFNYTDASNNQVTVVSNSGTTTVTGNQANCYTPAYWTGSAWSTISKTAGTVTTATPSSSLDVNVFTGTLTQTGSLSCRSYKSNSGTTHDLASNTLNVSGDMTVNGTFTSSTSTLNLTGSGNQTVGGSLSSLSLSNLGFASSGTKTLSMPASVTGAVTQTGTAVLATNGLTLVSTATGTARIDQLNAGSAVTGTITAERYIPANGRRWRFLASPVSGGTTLQWRDNAGSTSGRGTQITGATGTVDASSGNQSSAYRYNESSAVGGSNINAKWEAIDGSSALTNGRGYRVFVRGDRSISLTTPNTTNNATTLWVSGSNPTSPVSMSVTYNASLGNGWNLVGNPYPSPIDWSASTGWTKTNVGGTIWVWNPITNSYGSFDGTTATNSVTRYLASGQAFFVQATGSSPALSAGESVKVSNTPSNMFKAAERNSLRMTLVKDATESDEAVVRFMDNKSDEFNYTDDVAKPMMNPSVNISSYFGTDKYAIVNYMNTKSMDAKVIPLGASVAEAGTYDLNFAQVDGFDANINIYLKDNYNNTITDLRQNNKYAFTVDSKPESTMDGRLELIFVNKTSSIESVLAGRAANMTVYPNPAVDVLNVEITNANFKQSEVSIFSVSGVEVMNNNMMGNKKSLDIQKLSSGVYFVRVSNMETGFVNTVKFVK